MIHVGSICCACHLVYGDVVQSSLRHEKRKRCLRCIWTIQLLYIDCLSFCLLGLRDVKISARCVYSCI